MGMNGRQLSVFDFGIADKFDCQNCMWKKTYGFCYPKKSLGRQYFYEKEAGRYCSDYGTAFAHIKKQKEL